MTRYLSIIPTRTRELRLRTRFLCNPGKRHCRRVYRSNAFPSQYVPPHGGLNGKLRITRSHSVITNVTNVVVLKPICVN
jgi:hypothetical protein